MVLHLVLTTLRLVFHSTVRLALCSERKRSLITRKSSSRTRRRTRTFSKARRRATKSAGRSYQLLSLIASRHCGLITLTFLGKKRKAQQSQYQSSCEVHGIIYQKLSLEREVFSFSFLLLPFFILTIYYLNISFLFY